MADSSTWLALLTVAQAAKEAQVNGLFDAASPAFNFGRRAPAISGLTWAYYGGVIYVDGVRTKINNGTISLTASTTNYIEINRAGTVSKNTAGFTPGSIPLYTVVTSSSAQTSYTDHRPPVINFGGVAAFSFTADANKTAVIAEALCNIIRATSTVSLTATRNLVLPLSKGAVYIIENATTGGQAIQAIGATGTGITIANGLTAMVWCDGTNWKRATPDA